MSDYELSLEKFGSLGGDYFEHLVAAALDELGYIEGETYVPSWAKKCVPGTWVEADFIVGDKNGTDPENNGRKVFAIGHATSENSAQMKFHRDAEQLLEVKALANGDEFMVFDILFCCPRETMGGWSKELVQINEAIFDDSLTVWNHGWGCRLLWHIQQMADELKDGNNAVKKKRLRKLLDKRPAFNKEFQKLKAAIKKMLSREKSASKIDDMFNLERASRKERIDSELLIKSKEKTEYKRGLLQVLSLNDWELNLLYENHARNRSEIVSLERIAVEERGLPLADFDVWWPRLELLSTKIGSCSQDFDSDNVLDPDEKEYRFFAASDELAYAFDHFDLEALRSVASNVPDVAPNLVPYLADLRDLTRVERVCQILDESTPEEFFQLCADCYESESWFEMEVPRLLVFEVAKAAIRTEVDDYSYDKIANDSGNAKLIANPFTMRFIAGKRGNIFSENIRAGLLATSQRLASLAESKFSDDLEAIVQRFIYERFDGMVKQPKGGVLDALIDGEIREFAKSVDARVVDATTQGVKSVYNAVVDTENAGVNVEVPYVLALTNGQKIFIHRVMSDGGVGHKRKEFASKIRSIRYEASGVCTIKGRGDWYTSVLVVDGNWLTPNLEDKLMPIRMLTVAGWDHVIYPDQLGLVFDMLTKRLQADGLIS